MCAVNNIVTKTSKDYVTASFFDTSTKLFFNNDKGCWWLIDSSAGPWVKAKH